MKLSYNNIIGPLVLLLYETLYAYTVSKIVLFLANAHRMEDYNVELIVRM